MDLFDSFLLLIIAGLTGLLVILVETQPNAGCLDHATAAYCSTLTQ